MTSPMRNAALPSGFQLQRQSGSPEGRLLTLIVGSYNHRRYLDEAFEALGHTDGLEKLSVIFIDDGSTDGSLSHATSWPFDLKLHVRVFGKQNAGLRDSLRGGLELTETPYVAFMASDDRYEPVGLTTILQRLAQTNSPDLCWICQATYLEGRNGEKVYDDRTAALAAAAPAERLRQLSISFPKPLLLQSTVFGTAMLRRAGAFSDSIILDDWPTFLRVALYATHAPVDIAFLPDVVLCRYRLHEGGAHNNIERQLALCLEVAETLVEPPLRREAKARIYMDIGMIHLFERRFRRASMLFAYGITTFPRLDILCIVPHRIGSSLIRRFRRLKQS